MNFTVRNHYVPVWYQKRFMEDPKSKYYYLDLSPEKIFHPDGSFHFRRAIRRLGPKECFKDDHLYTVNFGQYAYDVIEKKFFGPIDNNGAELIEDFSEYELSQKVVDGYQQFLSYIDAQKFRTPKGLDYLKCISESNDHQETLDLMTRLWQLNCTIWSEGVWEIISCDSSPTKFILSDHPVTTYNRGAFPGSRLCKYPNDPGIELLGTYTLFPLSLNRCLIITNLGYVRNPNISPLRSKINPAYYEQRLIDLRAIQTKRQVDESYVLAINYIIKTRAKRFIAASRKEWLFPEQKLKTRTWNKLGDKFFLMPDPRKVKFYTDTVVGFKNGRAWGHDEYGRLSNESDSRIKRLRDKEFKTFEEHKKAWDSKFGPLDREDWLKYM